MASDCSSRFKCFVAGLYFESDTCFALALTLDAGQSLEKLFPYDSSFFGFKEFPAARCSFSGADHGCRLGFERCFFGAADAD